MKAMDFIMDINVHLMMGWTEKWEIPNEMNSERKAQEDKIRAVVNKILKIDKLKIKE